MKTVLSIIILLSLFVTASYSKDCNDYMNGKRRSVRIEKAYQIYLQPNSKMIGVEDTIKFNISFLGNFDYILTFCADREYYPINIRLVNETTNKEIYDNTTDAYIESLGIGFVNTQNVIVEVSLLANVDIKKRYKWDEYTCIGLIIQRKKF